MTQYGDNMPAHVLGNMWAQSWTNIYELVKPFSGVEDSLGEVTANMATNYSH